MHKGFPPSTPFPQYSLFHLQGAVVCTGLAVRPDSVGILFAKTKGIQGMGLYQSLELEGGDRNLNQALKIAIPSDDVQQSKED